MKTIIRILIILVLLGVIAILYSIYNSEIAQQEVLDEEIEAAAFIQDFTM